MANIVITSLDSNIRVDFNDFSPKYATKSIIRNKSEFNITHLESGGVVVNIGSFFKMTVYWDQLSIVDSVNGIAPTSNADLYEKIASLLVSLDNFITLVNEASSTITYIGKAISGSAIGDPVWRISRMDTTSGTVVLFADGSGDFVKIWSSRAGYTYS